MKKFLILTLMSLAFVACGNDDDDDNIFNDAQEAVEDTELQGKVFQSECMLEPIDAILTGILTGGQASVKSSRTEYVFEGNDITRTTLLYTGTDCTGDAFSYRETGEFDINKDQKTADNGSFMDINYNRLMLKMDAEAGATAANAINLCGASDWVSGQERDVSAQAANATCYGATVPRTNLNVYRLDAGKILLLGSPGTENGEARPTRLSDVKYTAK